MIVHVFCLAFHEGLVEKWLRTKKGVNKSKHLHTKNTLTLRRISRGARPKARKADFVGMKKNFSTPNKTELLARGTLSVVLTGG